MGYVSTQNFVLLGPPDQQLYTSSCNSSADAPGEEKATERQVPLLSAEPSRQGNLKLRAGPPTTPESRLDNQTLPVARDSSLPLKLSQFYLPGSLICGVKA